MNHVMGFLELEPFFIENEANPNCLVDRWWRNRKANRVRKVINVNYEKNLCLFNVLIYDVLMQKRRC